MITKPKSKSYTVKQCIYCCNDIHYNDQYCQGCKSYIKTGATKVWHAKELRIKTLLLKNNIQFTHDKIVDSSCSRKRPDFIIHSNWGVIVLEVDEHQHTKSYECECELSRMKQIYMDLGTEKVMFVRYNPDKYKSPITPYNKLKREEYLIKYIQEILTSPVPKWFLSSVYLFYDGFIPSSPDIEEYNPYHMDKFTIETITRNIIENSFETTVIDNCSAEYGIGFVVHDNNSDPLNKSFCEFVINIYPDSYQSKKILSKFIIKSLFSYIDLQS
jgi:hypothetical protein